MTIKGINGRCCALSSGVSEVQVALKLCGEEIPNSNGYYANISYLQSSPNVGVDNWDHRRCSIQ